MNKPIRKNRTPRSANRKSTAMKLNAAPPGATANTRAIPQFSVVPLERKRTTTTAKTGNAK